MISLHAHRPGNRRVLVLEDHLLLRNAMVATLSELPATSVVAAGTVRAALAEIGRTPPDLVVSDLDLPDGSGLELMPHLKGGSQIPIVFVSAHVSRFQSQLNTYPGVLVLDKPLPARTLKNVVVEQLETERPEEAPPFGAGDYIQLACMGRHTVRIDVAAAEVAGSILVRRGRLWAAIAGDRQGLAALSRLTFAPHARVTCSGTHADLGSANLPDRPWELLLLDLARHHDEGTREIAVVEPDEPRKGDAEDVDFSDIFDEGAVPLVPPGKPIAPQLVPVSDDGEAHEAARRFGQLIDQAADALLSKDYGAALRAYESAQLLKPEDSMIAGNVARLRELVSQ